MRYSSLALSMLETSIGVQLISRYHIIEEIFVLYHRFTIVHYEKANSFYRSKLSFFVQSSLTGEKSRISKSQEIQIR